MKYLQEQPYDESLSLIYSGVNVEPLVHKVWTGDFMGMCQHDIPCPKCFERSAIIFRNVDIRHRGEYQLIQPCWECAKQGWMLAKIPRWLRWLFSYYPR